MHHGAVRNCRTGICNLIRPTVPLSACNGKPKLRSASLRSGKFSNSTSPENQISEKKLNIYIQYFIYKKKYRKKRINKII